MNPEVFRTLLRGSPSQQVATPLRTKENFRTAALAKDPPSVIKADTKLQSDIQLDKTARDIDFPARAVAFAARF